MSRCLTRLWDDKGGVISSSEIVLVGTILVIGSIAGLSSLQSAMTHELNDNARACGSYNSSGDDRSSDHDYAISDSEGRGNVACDGF